MKIYLHNRILVFLFISSLLLLSLPASSQDNPSSSHSSLAEKIYLQLDNKVYTTDQTIWFKAIVANAAYHTPSQLSGVLYAELIDPSGNILERKLIKIEKGAGDGFFHLSPLYVYGMYQIRAYTEWNKNFGDDFFFKEYILVSGAKEEPFNPIKRLTIVEGRPNERRLNVQVDPSISDSLSGKSIQFVLEANGKKDTLSLKRNRSNQYLLDYVVPAQCEFLTLQIELDNAINYAKTIIIDTNYIDLQFFPESGELVHGLPAVLGFKALDYNGLGRKIEGEIVNEREETIASFKSNELGMGSVSLNSVDTAAKYTARIFSNKGLSKTYSLPPVVARGNTLSVKKQAEKIIIKARSNYLGRDSVTVRASCRGIIYYYFTGVMKNGNLEFSVDGNTLPEGIIDYTLFLIPSMTPVAERLFFNQRSGQRMNIAVASDKKEYTQREKTEITIATYDQDGQSVPANISVLAVNQSQQGKAMDLRQNILSYFLLSSDLKGAIENPGHYFTKDVDRSYDLDVLLLTQGWTKYNYTRETVAFRFQPEYNLTISGNVKGGILSNKIMKGAALTLVRFSKPPLFANAKTDSLGRFSFSLDDEYGHNLNIVIQTANKSDKKKQYLITLDSKEPPPVAFNHARSIQKPDSVVHAYIKQSIEHKKAEDAYRSANEGRTLEEVVVQTRILSPQQKEVTEKYGEPKVIISGKEIQAKEEKWSYGLYSVLLFQFPDKVKITRYGNGFLYASLHNFELTLVVIDGIPVQLHEYSLIPSIPPSEVKSFELIPLSKGFANLFCEVFPRACGQPGTPTVGNVIAIYTHAGKGLHGTRAPVGISKMVVPVFSKPREFYAPRHEQLKPEDWKKPDLRNLIHWDPKIKTDTTGKSVVSFYNSDNTGTIRLVVEAISENGEIGYSELLYDVREKNEKDISP